jgi:hypothetical protein
MRILICGDRNYSNVKSILTYLSSLPLDTIIIQGCCQGADLIARTAALKLGFLVLDFPADWQQYGCAAGPIRNRQMLTEGQPDLVVAFHDHLEDSKGTRNMISQALKANIPVEHRQSNGSIVRL